MKVLLSIFILMGFISWAQDGSLDSNFGNGGWVQYDLLEWSGDNFRTIKETHDNRLVSVGSIHDNSGNYNYIMAFNNNGDIDTSFGDNGFVLEPKEWNVSFDDMNLFGDGAILVRELISGTVNFKKYNAIGDFDETFANTGLLIPDYFAKSLILPDDSILLYGIKLIDGLMYLVLQKYYSDGMPDLTYGNDGVVQHLLSDEGAEIIQEPVLILNYKLVFGLHVLTTSGEENWVMIITPDGELDSTYGENGINVLPIEQEYRCSPNFIPGTNIAYVNCYYYNEPTQQYQWKMTKLNEAGEIDTSFGNNGFKMDMCARVVQPNGRFFWYNIWSDWEGGIHFSQFRRHYPNGYLDNSFQLQMVNNDYNAQGLKVFHRKNGQLMIAGATAWYNDIGAPDVILQQFNNSPLGIEEFELSHIQIAPNPSDAIFKITFADESFLGLHYSVFDITGKMIQVGTIDQSNFYLDLTGFESGMYFLNTNQHTYKLLKN